MVELAKEVKDQHARIKKSVEMAHSGFNENYKRYNKFQKFSNETTLQEQDKTVLESMGTPVVEFNLGSMYIDRLVGEFYMHQPSVIVDPSEGVTLDDQKMLVMHILEDHLRHIVDKAKSQNILTRVYKEQLDGGFSNYKLETKYASEGASPTSFCQIPVITTQDDPVYVGYDLMAKELDKSDAKFYYEIYQWKKKELEEEYDIKLDSNLAGFNVEGFRWFGSGKDDNTVLVCDYYEVVKKKFKIVQIAAKDENGNYIVMREDEYKEKLKEYEEGNHIEQPPQMIGKPRKTYTTSIVKYTLIGDRILEKEDTIFTSCPSRFAAGTYSPIKDESGANYKQFYAPYLYHIEGTQRVKNLAGQTWAREIEDMSNVKLMTAIESLPATNSPWLAAWVTPQKAAVLAYQGFDRNNPDKALPPPIPLNRVPLPPEVVSAFNNADTTIQAILGSFDMNLGEGNQVISGEAFIQGATQSNPVAQPYLIGNLQALNGILNEIVKIIPKLYKTPMTLPVMGIDGKKDYVKINQPNAPDFNYDDNIFNVKVKAGVNSSIAKNQAMQQITALMRNDPTGMWAKFFMDKGIPVILDNLEFRGSEYLKAEFPKWLDDFKKQQMQAQQNMPNPEQTKLQLAQIKAQSEQAERQAKLAIADSDNKQKATEHYTESLLRAKELELTEQELKLGLISTIHETNAQKEKVHAENFKTEAELHMRHHDQMHQHSKDFAEISHKIISEGNKNATNQE